MLRGRIGVSENFRLRKGVSRFSGHGTNASVFFTTSVSRPGGASSRSFATITHETHLRPSALRVELFPD